MAGDEEDVLKKPYKDRPAKTMLSDGRVLARMVLPSPGRDRSAAEKVRAGFETLSDGTTVRGLGTEVDSLGGRIVLDSACRHAGPDSPTYLFAEVQSSPYEKYPLCAREEFYKAVMTAWQQGREFSGDDYGGLARALFYWIVVHPRKADRGTVRLRETTDTILDSRGGETQVPSQSRARIVEVNICHPDAVGDVEPLRFLCTMFFPGISPGERKRRLKEEYNIVIQGWMEQDLEGLSYMGYSEELIEGRIRTERFDAREEGIAKGREEERKEARAEMVRSYAKTVAGMLSKGLTLEEAMELIPKEISEDVRRSVA